MKDTVIQMLRLVEVVLPHAEDKTTLNELHRMIGDEESWRKAHDLFDRIRRKALKPGTREEALHQYAFEEICAKTLFNFTDTNVPFDSDSPYWVVPLALQLAQILGMDEKEIIKIVTRSDTA